MINPQAKYLFVIDTSDYAGNFERELCAYITGRYGDCEVGEDCASAFEEETSLEPFENVIAEPDDHGCYRPVTIFLDRDEKQYNSVAVLFEDRPTPEQIDIMKERAFKYAKSPHWLHKDEVNIQKILGFRLIKQEITVKRTVENV